MEMEYLFNVVRCFAVRQGDTMSKKKFWKWLVLLGCMIVFSFSLAHTTMASPEKGPDVQQTEPSLTPEIQTAVEEALTRTPYQPEQPSEKWIILDQTVGADWAIVMAELDDEAVMGRVLSDLIYVIARRENETGWRAITFYDSEWQNWLDVMPESILSPDMKAYLWTIGTPMISQTQSVIYYFPWACQEPAKVNQGHHDTYAIDFGLIGNNVVASSVDGSVTFAKWDSNTQCICRAWTGYRCTGGWGMPNNPSQSCPWTEANRVLINDADGVTTWYLHLAYDSIPTKFKKDYTSSPPEPVSHGETIGLEGSTGWSTGPHLHFWVYDQPFVIKNGDQSISSWDLDYPNSYTSLNCNNADTSPPETAINSSPNGWSDGTASSSFTWTGSDSPPSALTYRYRLVGGAWSDWTTAVSQTYGPNALPHGWHTFEVQARDAAGNVDESPAQASFGIDLLAPNPPLITASGNGCSTAQNNVWQNTCRDVAFNWTAVDQGSGLKDYGYVWSATANTPPTTFSTVTSYDPGPIAAANGFAQWYLNIKSRDNVNRVSGLSTFGLWYDGTTPTVSLQINGGAPTTSQVDVILNLTSADSGSGVKWVRVSNNGSSWTAWMPYSSALPWLLPAVNHYSPTVYVQVSDEAGNISTIATDTIEVSLYPPAPHSANYRLCQSVVNAGGSGNASSLNYKAFTSIGEAQASGAAGMTSSSYVLHSGFEANQSGCLPITDPLPFGYTVTRSVMASGGALRSSLSYHLGDTVGEAFASGGVLMTSPSYQLSSGFWAGQTAVILPPPSLNDESVGGSTAPPLPVGMADGAFGVVINDGALYANQLAVTLSLPASNMTEMRLADDEALLATAVWQSYQLTTTWVLTDEAESLLPSPVWAEFQDKDGNVYGPFLAEILYDGQAPEGLTAVLGSDGDAPLGLYVDAWDDNSRVTLVGVGWQADMSDAVWQTFTNTLELSGTNPLVYVQFQDQAGNRSTVYGPDAGTNPTVIYLPVAIQDVNLLKKE